MKITNQGISSIIFILTILGIVILTSMQFQLEEGFGHGCHPRAKNTRDSKYNQTCTIGDNGDMCQTWDKKKHEHNVSNHHSNMQSKHIGYCQYRKRLLEQYKLQLRRWQFPSNTPKHIITYRNHYWWYNRKGHQHRVAARRSRGWRRRHHYNAASYYDRMRNSRADLINKWVNTKIQHIDTWWPQPNNWWTTIRGWQQRADMHTHHKKYWEDRKDNANTEMMKQECDWHRHSPVSTKYDSHKCWYETKDGLDKNSKERCDNFWNMQNNKTSLQPSVVWM